MTTQQTSGSDVHHALLEHALSVPCLKPWVSQPPAHCRPPSCVKLRMRIPAARAKQRAHDGSPRALGCVRWSKFNGGRLLATADMGGAVRVWDPFSAKRQVAEVRCHTAAVKDVRYDHPRSPRT